MYFVETFHRDEDSEDTAESPADGAAGVRYTRRSAQWRGLKHFVVSLAGCSCVSFDIDGWVLALSIWGTWLVVA